MNRSDTIGQLAKALALAQVKVEGATRDADNPYFKSRYATLSSVWDACHVALNEQGIAVMQAARCAGTQVSVETILAHESGEWISDTLTMEAADARPQTIGSAITYGRRYGLSAMVGVAPEDDDGNAAHGRPATADIGNPSRKTAPATDAEVDAAIPLLSEDEEKDPRPRFRSGDLTCPHCKVRKVILRKDTSAWFCSQQTGGCGGRWPNPKSVETVEAPVLVSSSDDMAEKSRLMTECERLFAKLPNLERSRTIVTYCGSTEWKKADIAAVNDMLKFLRTRAGE